MSTYHLSSMDLEIMLWLYQNKGYHVPSQVSKALSFEPPTVRRMIRELLIADYLISRKIANGNEYRTTPSRFRKFLKHKKKQIKKFKA